MGADAGSSPIEAGSPPIEPASRVSPAGSAAGAFAGLLLADGRFPSGAHIHSWGLEAAVQHGLVTDLADLERWILGALHAVWRIDAAVAAAACGLGHAAAAQPVWTRLDREVSARMLAPPLRAASRRVGRQLVRTGARAWPGEHLALLAQAHPEGPHAAVALGAVAAAAGIAAAQAAVVALHHAVLGAATAAVRLLGLDPYAVTGAVAALAGDLAEVAAAATAPCVAVEHLPAGSAPMLDLLAAAHAQAEGRMFAT